MTSFRQPRWAVAVSAAALLAVSAGTPAHAQENAAPEVNAWLYCGAALTSYSGFLLGRFEADSSFGYDGDQAADLRRDGLASTLMGLELYSRGDNPSRDGFVVLLEAAAAGQRVDLDSSASLDAAESYYSATLARCADLRATSPVLFETMAAEAEVQFADLIEETREAGQQ